MAGAFGALGGDASAIKDNPAGLGIYRKSELVGSMNVMMQNSTSVWNDVTSIYENPYKTGFNNFSLVFAIPTSENGSVGSGLVSSNWSFSYNRLKDFNRSMNIKSGASSSSITDYMAYFSNGITASELEQINNPYDNMYVPWISVAAFNGYLMNPKNGNQWESVLDDGQSVIPLYKLTEKGHLDEYSIGWAGNFSNSFYLGATVNFQSLNYTHIAKYTEDFGYQNNMILGDTIYSKGNGMNLNIGCIFRPTNYLRLGLSLQTPSIYSISDNYYSTLKYDIDTIGYGSVVSPLPPSNDFKLQGPLKINASAALIVGKKGTVSVEYNYSNTTGMQLLDKDGNNENFILENEKMKTNLNNLQTVKIGGEYKVTDNFSLRAGYANSSNANNPDVYKKMYENSVRMDPQYFIHNSTNYLTAGFGYREASWFIDFAYVNKIIDETFHPYDYSSLNIKPTAASVITKSNNLVVTLGLKF